MIEKILERFIYEGIEYIICTQTFNLNLYRVDYPYVMITTKSSKRKRNKKLDKLEAHFSRIDIKQPIKLVKHILSVYEKEYKNTGVVFFNAHNDSKYKREKLYIKCLESIGFKLIKAERNIGHILIKDGLKIKKKDINNILKSLE